MRPRALLLLPTRNMARTVAWRLMTLAQKRTRTDTYQGVERLNKEFGDGEEVEDKPRKGGAKPLEHQALFAGNW